MASLAGSPQLNMNGVLGGLNGVIQSPVQNAPQPTLPALRPQPPPLNPQALAQGFQHPKSVSPYVPGLSVNQLEKKSMLRQTVVLFKGKRHHVRQLKQGQVSDGCVFVGCLVC